MTLFMVAASLFMLLGVAGLAIDLVSLYVARSEAQRAADSAALAGAKTLVGYISGTVISFAAQTAARDAAKTAGGQNLVGGQAAQIDPNNDVSFDLTNPQNPRITVQVNRTAASAAAGFGNPMPTLFMRAFGVTEKDVSAVATAEAYSPSGGGPSVCTGCVKPWIMPNCDPNHDSELDTMFCSTDRYVDEVTGTIINSGPVATGGVIGQTIVIKPSEPGEAPAPSQFYPIQIPPGTDPAICPECAGTAGGSEGPGAALYRRNISCCNTNKLYCGQTVDVDTQTGNMVGPTRQGVQCLIHQGPGGSGGQDELISALPPLFLGGDNNPIPALVGKNINQSDSVVTLPLYDGHNMCPGGAGSCGTVTIVGFLQLFIIEANVGGSPPGRVTAVVLNVAGCGAGGGGTTSCGGGGGGGGPIGGGYTPFPVRLIRQ
jgi:hypothetical protein